jgi:trimethylamine--corrinoid protein Co-methyltransferase
MRTLLQVLSDEERARIHEQTLSLLAKTGLRVDTERGRAFLREAGAEVNEETRRVLFPSSLVESALKAVPRQVTLGGRRPGWTFPLNAGECTLQADGAAVYVYDTQTGLRRQATYDDWLLATRLIEALDEVGVYWAMVEPTFSEGSLGDFVCYWRDIFRNFTKHVQDCTVTAEQSRWMLEVLQVAFGSREEVQRLRPLSFLLCPFSPLVIESEYTDAYLETIGWDIPLAVMPMPMMGATAPGSLVSTITLANCEVLAMLCLVEAAAPGTPFIYAAAPTVMDPRSGRFSGGEIENALLGAAVTEMARYYGLPAESTTGSCSHHIPGIQATYERSLNWCLPILSWPDMMIGPGLLAGAMTLSIEQLMLDVEVYRRCRRLHQGVVDHEGQWLEAIISEISPGGNFLAKPSTRDAVRSGEWYLERMGVHETYEAWEAAGRPELLSQVREQVEKALQENPPLPLSKEVEQEIDKIEKQARQETGHR